MKGKPSEAVSTGMISIIIGYLMILTIIRLPIYSSIDQLIPTWRGCLRCFGQLYLLGYARDDGVQWVYLEAAGPYENFYRDLKR